MTVRDYTVFDNTNVYRYNPTTYLISSDWTITGSHSDLYYITRSYTTSVDAEGYFYPDPGTCYGGGKGTDSFTVTR